MKNHEKKSWTWLKVFLKCISWSSVSKNFQITVGWIKKLCSELILGELEESDFGSSKIKNLHYFVLKLTKLNLCNFRKRLSSSFNSIIDQVRHQVSIGSILFTFFFASS